jgi:hypothetical protein
MTRKPDLFVDMGLTTAPIGNPYETALYGLGRAVDTALRLPIAERPLRHCCDCGKAAALNSAGLCTDCQAEADFWARELAADCAWDARDDGDDDDDTQYSEGEVAE